MIPRGRYTPGQEPSCLCEFDASNQWGLWTDDSRTTRVTATSQQIAVVDDRTGKGRHARQTTATKRPTYTVTSGKPGSSFDGVDDLLQTDRCDWGSTQKYEIWAIVTQSSFGGDRFIFTQCSTAYTDAEAVGIDIFAGRPTVFRSSPGSLRITTNTSTLSTTLVRATVDTTQPGATEFYVEFDGDSLASNLSQLDSTYAVGTRRVILGNSGTAAFPYAGKIHQLNVFGALLDTSGVARVRRYMRSKWGTA